MKVQLAHIYSDTIDENGDRHVELKPGWRYEGRRVHSGTVAHVLTYPPGGEITEEAVRCACEACRSADPIGDALRQPLADYVRPQVIQAYLTEAAQLTSEELDRLWLYEGDDGGAAFIAWAEDVRGQHNTLRLILEGGAMVVGIRNGKPVTDLSSIDLDEVKRILGSQ